MPQTSSPISEQIHAAIDWWREAGVDLEFTDDATDWLAENANPNMAKAEPKSAKKSAVPQEPAPEKNIDLLGPNSPKDLHGFREWWLSEPALDAVGVRGRIAPTGPANPELMILVITPEEADTRSLLSGSQGKLLDAFLRAAGLERDNIYLSAILPRHAPVIDGAAIASAGYDKVLMHHIGLVDPKRLLVFGKNILPLFGHEAAQDSATLQNIKHDDRKIPLLIAEGLDSMLAMPRLKAKFWRNWLDWMDG
jgi:DNA polymerase